MLVAILASLLFVLIGVFIGYRLGRRYIEKEVGRLQRRVRDLEDKAHTLEVRLVETERDKAALIAQVEKTKHEAEERIKKARRQAVEASRGVLTGKIGERMAPLFPHFPVSPTEACFVNFGIDYIGFPGYDERNVQEVVLIEVKTGSSQLGPIQAQIRRCVSEGKVRFVVYRPDEAAGITTE